MWHSAGVSKISPSERTTKRMGEKHPGSISTCFWQFPLPTVSQTRAPQLGGALTNETAKQIWLPSTVRWSKIVIFPVLEAANGSETWTMSFLLSLLSPSKRAMCVPTISNTPEAQRTLIRKWAAKCLDYRNFSTVIITGKCLVFAGIYPCIILVSKIDSFFHVFRPNA